jgi:hypothetical protein
MYSDIAKPTDISDTEWDRRSYNMFVVPISHMANAPRVIIDSTLAASNNGVGDVKLLSRLPAFNLTLNSGLPDPWRDEAQQSNLTSDSSHNAPTPLPVWRRIPCGMMASNEENNPVRADIRDAVALKSAIYAARRTGIRA